MARWRQKYDPVTRTSTFIPIDEGARQSSSGVAIHGDIDGFVSPIDGTVIRDRKQYREHCRKHGVVPAQEFSAEHYRVKAEERARTFTGNSTKEETLARRREMYEIAMRMERENGR